MARPGKMFISMQAKSEFPYSLTKFPSSMTHFPNAFLYFFTNRKISLKGASRFAYFFQACTWYTCGQVQSLWICILQDLTLSYFGFEKTKQKTKTIEPMLNSYNKAYLRKKKVSTEKVAFVST